MDNVKIALIDSGLNKDHFTDLNSVDGISFMINNNSIIKSNMFDDENGHGTSCTDIICRNIIEKNSIDVFMVKILNNMNISHIELLINALEYLTNVDINIINISISTVMNNQYYEYYKDLKHYINILSNQGKYILTSIDNDPNKKNILTSFEKVISVMGVPLDTELSYWYNYKNNNCVASNIPVMTQYNNTYKMFFGNSKATAVMTSVLANLILKYQIIDSNKLKYILSSNAIKTEWENSDIDDVYEDAKSFILNNCNSKISRNSVQYSSIKKIISKYIHPQFINEIDKRPLLSLGINKNNCYELLKEIETKLDCIIKYDKVNIYAFISIETIINLIN